MRHRLPSALLVLALLAACSEDEPAALLGRTSLTPESTAEPNDGGALDAVADSLRLQEAGNDTFVSGLVLDPAGEPILLVSTGDGEGRQLLRPTVSEGWTSLAADAFGDGAEIRDLLGATDDGVLVVTVQGRRPYLCTVAADAAVRCDAVPGAAQGAATASGMLTRDGATLYLLSGPADGPFTVAAVDPSTGAVRASAAAPPGALVGFAGADLVFLDTGTVEESRAEITRLTADLRPAGTAEIDASYVRSSGGGEDAVYAGRLVPDDGGSLGEVSLLAVPPEGAGTETVWSVPDALLLSALDAPVVDPEGAWAYLPTQQHDPDGDGIVVRLTPVDLDTGEAAGTVTLCDGYQFGGMVVAPDGTRAFAAARCNGSGVPTLFTLG